MNNGSHDESDKLDLEAPPGLRQELSRLWAPPAGVPADVDEAVLAAARRSLKAPRRARPWYRWVPAGAAAAAMLAVGVWLWRPDGVPKRGGGPIADVGVGAGPQPSVAIEGDLDGNGRIDILDAFALARRIERGAAAPEWDFNDDGAVNRADVDTVAGWAVRLERG